MAVRTDRPEMYEAARGWRDAALLDDDSLFTPGKEIWSTRWLEELRQRFVVKADEGRDPFSTKLQRQLKDAWSTGSSRSGCNTLTRSSRYPIISGSSEP